jgi:hypothetical protein
LLGPNYLGRENREDFFGQSALLAPISLTHKGDGILLQAGTDRTETIIAGELPLDELYALRQEGRFRPRQQMWLGELGPVLADFYEQGLTIEQVIEQDSAPVEEMAVAETPASELVAEAAPAFAPVTLEPELPEQDPEELPETQPEATYPSVAEVLSLTGKEEPEE